MDSLKRKYVKEIFSVSCGCFDVESLRNYTTQLCVGVVRFSSLKTMNLSTIYRKKLLLFRLSFDILIQKYLV